MSTATLPVYQGVSPALLQPSPLNPRTKFKEKDLDDLVVSIKRNGIIEPLVVRPFGTGNGFEIVCGERRWRAATAAGLKEVPIVIRDIDDLAVVQLQLDENLKRKDMHPLDEAKGFEEWLHLDKQATAASVAAQTGMSERYVMNRIHYRDLEKSVREAFYEDRITAGHADLLVRLEKEDQKRALAACFVETFYDAQDEGVVDVEDDAPRLPGKPAADTRRLVSVRELDRWIKGNVRIEIAARSPRLELYPEVQQAVQAVAATPKAERRGLLELTDSHYLHERLKDPPLLHGEWKEVGKKKCDHVARGVIVLGAQQGRVLDVCLRESKCKTHWPPAPPIDGGRSDGTHTSTRKLSKYELQAKATQKAARRWGQVRKSAVAAARQKAKGVSLSAALPVLAYGLKPWSTPPPVLEKLVAYVLEHKTDYTDRAAFQKHIAGPLGVNLKAVELQVFPPKAKKGKKKSPARQVLEAGVKADGKLRAKKKLGLSATAPKGEARPLGTKAKGGRRRKAGKKR